MRDLLIGVISGIFSGIATGIGSQISTGTFTLWFIQNPILIVLFPSVVISSIIVSLIRKKLSSIHERSFFKIPNSYYDWFDVGEITYNGILWTLKSTNTYNPENDAMFAYKPKCPKCKTELENNTSFWGGDIMKCIRCGYKKKIRDYHNESERVVKLARREFEKQKGK